MSSMEAHGSVSGSASLDEGFRAIGARYMSVALRTIAEQARLESVTRGPNGRPPIPSERCLAAPLLEPEHDPVAKVPRAPGLSAINRLRVGHGRPRNGRRPAACPALSQHLPARRVRNFDKLKITRLSATVLLTLCSLPWVRGEPDTPHRPASGSRRPGREPLLDGLPECVP